MAEFSTAQSAGTGTGGVCFCSLEFISTWNKSKAYLIEDYKVAAAGDFHFYTKSRRSVIKSSRNKSQ